MSSAAEQARRQVEADFFLQETLARGITNVKGLARWLKENRGLEGSVEAIATGIYDFDAGTRPRLLQDAVESLGRANLNHEGERSAIGVTRLPSESRGLPRVLRRLVPEDPRVLRFFCGEKETVVIVHSSLFTRLEADIEDSAIVETYPRIDDLHLITEDGGPISSTMVKYVTASLRLKGIDILFETSGLGEHIISVDSYQGIEAADIIRQLKQSQ